MCVFLGCFWLVSVKLLRIVQVVCTSGLGTPFAQTKRTINTFKKGHHENLRKMPRLNGYGASRRLRSRVEYIVLCLFELWKTSSGGERTSTSGPFNY